jgi:futalosine hydrolase
MAAGVGLVNTAQGLTAMIETYRPEIIIMSGCGGGFAQAGMSVGDLAVATTEIDAQLGIEPKDKDAPPGSLPFPVKQSKKGSYSNRIPVDQTLAASVLQALTHRLSTSKTQVVTGPFITVSTITATDERAEKLFSWFSCCIESMEGAAGAQVADLYEIPFVEIRSSSNRVGDRDRSVWDLRTAFKRSAFAVKGFLEHLKITECK